MARVLMISYTTSYSLDGRLKRQAEGLSRRGDEVDVICLSAGPIADTNGVRILELRIPRYRGPSRRRYLASYLRFIVRAAALAVRRSLSARYDLVVALSMPDALVISALPCRLFGSKILLDVQDTMPELYLDKFEGSTRGRLGARLMMLEERLSARLADRVLAVHAPHAERLQQAGIPPGKIAVVTNSPDPRIFKSASAAAGGVPHNGRPNGSHFTVVFHGTLTHRLGLDTAIKAVALLGARLPDLLLRIIGCGDNLDELKALARRLAVESLVSFEDPIPVEQLPAKLAGTSVGLVPNHATRSTQLMLPVKLLEFATLGIPVIASRLRTIEYYFDEDAIRYFTPGDSQALAEAIEELYFSAARRLALARRASEMVKKLDWPYFEVIDSLLDRPRAEQSVAAGTRPAHAECSGPALENQSDRSS